ncbi:hypothetical protein HUG10_05610 [Halorarum halophilum]|uniref:DUF7508 domain-containing protein n=1 Tax=Halorarum halophilum TaxID=2743090 RepID=A0A7D5GGU5_9EURY|nr:hypothetical protein [Halobaculum halophilum]QLG27051.1 hypothetical protein HUG10_05610 [Halobaculum halophilum]
MSLRRQWRKFDRSAVGAAPERYGVYELGDEEGDSLGYGVGVLRDELKEELAYGEAAKVRWIAAESEDHAERLADEHF